MTWIIILALLGVLLTIKIVLANRYIGLSSLKRLFQLKTHTERFRLLKSRGFDDIGNEKTNNAFRRGNQTIRYSLFDDQVDQINKSLDNVGREPITQIGYALSLEPLNKRQVNELRVETLKDGFILLDQSDFERLKQNELIIIKKKTNGKIIYRERILSSHLIQGTFELYQNNGLMVMLDTDINGNYCITIF
jgi:hypothetical protein